MSRYASSDAMDYQMLLLQVTGTFNLKAVADECVTGRCTSGSRRKGGAHFSERRYREQCSLSLLVCAETPYLKTPGLG
jgi:hypothetical protein